MPRKKWDHEIHKYMKVVFNNRQGGTTEIWRCILPNCQHYLVGEMVLGKLCLCNRCEENVFEMNRSHLSKKWPHCLDCTKEYKNHKAKKKPAIADISAHLEDLLKVE